jgi:hypothetical protein
VSKLSWDYDDAGRPEWEKQRFGTDATGDEKTVSYQYDDNGNVTQIAYPARFRRPGSDAAQHNASRPRSNR